MTHRNTQSFKSMAALMYQTLVCPFVMRDMKFVMMFVYNEALSELSVRMKSLEPGYLVTVECILVLQRVLQAVRPEKLSLRASGGPAGEDRDHPLLTLTPTITSPPPSPPLLILHPYTLPSIPPSSPILCG